MTLYDQSQEQTRHGQMSTGSTRATEIFSLFDPEKIHPVFMRYPTLVQLPSEKRGGALVWLVVWNMNVIFPFSWE